MSNEQLLELTKDCLGSIARLVVNTENTVVKQLNIFHGQLSDSTFNESDEKALQDCIEQGQKLVSNLQLAKEAVAFTSSKLTATNRPVNWDANMELERSRYKLNNTELTCAFGIFQRKREELERVSGKDMGFVQTAYRKGVGFNIGMWYGYAHTAQSTKKWGNCTEQSNAAFGYLYSRAREQFTLNKLSPIKSIQRIDVINNIGGHCYVLIDGMDDRAVRLREPFTSNELMRVLSQLSTAVVVDPWNTEHPFYPVADIPRFMPECGLKGEMNIEFRLGLSTPESEDLHQSHQRSAL